MLVYSGTLAGGDSLPPELERERERERKGERERARVRESEREADLAGSDVLPLELALPHEFLFPTSLLVRQSLRLRWVA